MNTLSTRPEITDERITDIRNLIASDITLNRSKLSRLLCEQWNWRSPVGQIKDIRCRALLRELDRKGLISLPAALSRPRIAGKRATITHIQHDTTSVECDLFEVLPLHIEIVQQGTMLADFKSYIDQYYYLGMDRTIGECMRYLVSSKTGTPLACLLFGSASWSCAARDQHIGWDKKQRAGNLPLLTNNTRLLIFPWVRVSNLASHTLAKVLKRLSADWINKYGHEILAVETYVDSSRFRGICYQAANWQLLGQTTGRGRDGGHHSAILPVKDVYLYPLDKSYRSRLTGKVYP
jgi:hypothetical protein